MGDEVVAAAGRGSSVIRASRERIVSSATAWHRPRWSPSGAWADRARRSCGHRPVAGDDLVVAQLAAGRNGFAEKGVAIVGRAGAVGGPQR
jgi:hypothetical protein